MTPQELVIAARRFVDELVRAEQLEVRRASVVAAALAAYLATLKRAPTGGELEDWLGGHKQVEELYASAAALETLGDRYFRPPPIVDAVVAREPDLERQLQETLEPHAYLVYADWLQEHGDPFGELIALGVAATTGDAAAKARFTAFLEHNEKQFVHGIRNDLGSLVRMEWRYGFITRVDEISVPMGVTRWRRLLDLRVASLVRSITLHDFHDPEVDALIAERAPALRELRLYLGRMPTEILKGPQLETLAVHMAHVTLDATKVPSGLVRLELEVQELQCAAQLARLEVRELVLHRSMWRVTGTPFGPLAGLALPNLELLELDGLDGTLVDTCDRVLAKLALPKLRRVVVRRCRVGAADLARLATMAFAPQLTELVLQDLALTDDVLAALAPLAQRAKLSTLDIDGNELSPAGVAVARTLATRVVVGKQRTTGAAALDAIRTLAAGRLAAGEAIADPTAWPTARVTGDLRWARYDGTNEYEVFVSTDLARWGCSCPSSYQPCKHVVALALIATRVELPSAPAVGFAFEDQRL